MNTDTKPSSHQAANSTRQSRGRRRLCVSATPLRHPSAGRPPRRAILRLPRHSQPFAARTHNTRQGVLR